LGFCKNKTNGKVHLTQKLVLSNVGYGVGLNLYSKIGLPQLAEKVCYSQTTPLYFFLDKSFIYNNRGFNITHIGLSRYFSSFLSQGNSKNSNIYYGKHKPYIFKKNFILSTSLINYTSLNYLSFMSKSISFKINTNGFFENKTPKVNNKVNIGLSSFY